MTGEASSARGLVLRYFSQLQDLYGDRLLVADVPSWLGAPVHPSLDAFERAICGCQKCPLGQTRTRFVFGVGNPGARLVLVGEAPGREEDLKGEPFVGKAGHLLDRILKAIELTRRDVYICNVLKCRPPGNRTPSADEIDTCLPYLETQLEMIKPSLIVALGGVAAHALLSVKTPIGQLRSRLWRWKSYDLLVTYHPAALLRNERLKRPAWEDFQEVQRILGLRKRPPAGKEG
ncbi:MAG: uracil-DNA glycosylase [Fidelibacterota bacterium]